MSKQRSPKIEDFAYDFLQSHYRAAYTATSIKVKQNVQTRADKQVDALFLFDTVDNSPFCAALVTASSSGLANLLTRYKKNGLSKWRFLTAFLALIGIGFLLKAIVHWAIAAGIAVAAALALFILHSVLEKKQLKGKISDLVDNVDSFPANEKWLGISISSLTFRNNDLARHLLQLCQQKGIGILTVGQRAKVVLMQEPKALHSRGENFIANYILPEEPEAKPQNGKKGPDSNLKVA
ncbi:hypothetical protein ACMA1I_16005 [Pontibacter sp. 13R65]|uniref:hypothetical protein n=1 Tax=Pontibacter sp. 13R65 TaxID=3127458 RepID=UPI00301D25F1